jgi:hypothetical protein
MDDAHLEHASEAELFRMLDEQIYAAECAACRAELATKSSSAHLEVVARINYWLGKSISNSTRSPPRDDDGASFTEAPRCTPKAIGAAWTGDDDGASSTKARRLTPKAIGAAWPKEAAPAAQS